MTADNTNPDYYKFPSGAEVIDISEHLTANAAQAVQYIARSCRIDGHNKPETELSLKKAAWFIQRELDRIQVDRWGDA